MAAMVIEAWQQGDRQAVVDLILPIQTAEFAIPITAEQQPDLQDVAQFYQQGCGGFWVARAQGQVVGCIALKDIGGGEAALRKMFVAAEWRGREYGVAAALLEHLLARARAQQVKTVYLGTTAAFLAAHRFYEKHGFSQVEVDQLPASFPVMKVDTRFYKRDLV